MSDVFFSVKVEGEEVGDLLDRLEVEESDSRADLATLVLGDSYLVLADLLHEGLTVEIDLGWSDAHALIFRGPVTGVRASYPARGKATVEVQATDSLILLGFKPNTKRWWNTTISQVVRDVAVANGLQQGRVTVAQDPTLDEKRPRQQVEETDLAFLHRLARDYDCKVFVEARDSGDALNFISTRTLLQADPIEEQLAFNANVEEFSAAFDAFATAAAERLVTTDPQTGDRDEVSTTLATAEDAQWAPAADRIARTGAAADRLAALAAKGAAKRARLLDFWRLPPRDAGAAARPSSDSAGALGDQARRLGQAARGRARGSVWLRPRRRVNVVGYGGRWSGAWYLARVRHEIDLGRRSYLSSFLCTR
jgi:phage protein D